MYALVYGLVIGRWLLSAVGKCEGELYGLVGEMTMIVVIAYTIR